MPATKKKSPKTFEPTKLLEFRIPNLPADHVRRFRVATSYNGENIKTTILRLTGEYIEETETRMRKEMLNESNPRSK